ncbi:uncharacterized protein [Drosophila bipectinata]|uniref:uncharacterized protein n=1 Tax=Drosophila bipectinata TaxID=42026 RepID=UPI0038B3EA83
MDNKSSRPPARSKVGGGAAARAASVIRAVAKGKSMSRLPGALGITIGGEIKDTRNSEESQAERDSNQPPHHGGVGFAGGAGEVIPDAADPGGHIRFGSEASGAVIIGEDGSIFRRDTSVDIPVVSRTMSAAPTCHGGWNNQSVSAPASHQGRDTLGFAFHLGTATLGHTRCSLGTPCDEECGYGTGCDAGCAIAHGQGSISSGAYDGLVTGMGTGIAGVHGGVPGGYRGGGPGGQPPGGNAPWRPGGNFKGGPGGPPGGGGGYRGSFEGLGGDQVNFFITFLLEVLGVLVFFAICTITFWITLGYHVVTLLVDLKNAERNVQVAVAIVFGVLLLAFAISLITNHSGSCCHAKDRHRSRSRSSCPFARPKPKSKPKHRSCPHAKVSCPAKPRCKKPAERRRSTCGMKAESAFSPCRRKVRYTDCEGRAIFINSRRYAIPTEMKQPPTMVLWLRDMISRWMQ